MSFEPEKIAKQNILDAAKKIENEKIALEPSTRFDVIIANKAYPPKEIKTGEWAVSNVWVKESDISNKCQARFERETVVTIMFR